MSMLASIYKFIAEHAILVAIVSGFLGALVADALKFREYRRANVQVDLEKSKISQLPVNKCLQKFSDKANGRFETTSEDLRELKESLSALRSNAQSLHDRIHRLDDDFKALSSSIVDLQKSAQGLTGPLDGKKFVEAVAAFYAASNNFFSNATRRQQSWSSIYTLRE